MLTSLLFQGTKILSPHDKREITCDEGLPEGAEFKGFCHDHSTNCINVFFEHESFGEVEDGQQCPTGVGVFTTKPSPEFIGAMTNRWQSLEHMNKENWNKYITDTAEGLLAETTEVPEQATIEVTVRIHHHED